MARSRPPRAVELPNPSASKDNSTVVTEEETVEPSPTNVVLNDYLNVALGSGKAKPSGDVSGSGTKKDAPRVSTSKTYSQVLKNSSKVMNLSYVHVVDSSVTIEEGDIVKEVEYWQTTLVGTVLGKQLTLVQIESLVSNPTVIDELNVTHVPVWVLFPNLDPCFWSKAGLSKVASAVGNPICADEHTTNKSKLAFARILIDVDHSKELPKAIKINSPYRGTLLQSVAYEWVPHFCTCCKTIGHTKDRCNPAGKPKTKAVYRPKQPVSPQNSGDVGNNKPTSPQKEVYQQCPVKKTVATNLFNRFSMLQNEDIIEPTSTGLVTVDVESGDEQDLDEVQEAHHFLLVNKVDCGALIETHVKHNAIKDVHCSLLHIASHKCIEVTFVYPFNARLNRRVLWDKLQIWWITQLQVVTLLGITSRESLTTLLAWLILLTCLPIENHLSPQFQDSVKERWSNQYFGSHIGTLFLKLKKLRGYLRRIHTFSFTNLSDRVAGCKQALYQCQDKLSNSPMDPTLIDVERNLLQDYLMMKRAEIQVLFQRAKVQKLRLNDFSTTFFYFRLADRRDTIPFDTYNLLVQQVRVQEILDALKSIDRNKNPGIDGYSSRFFLDAWNLVVHDFKAAIFEFFQTCTMPKAANSTLLVLIPKMETPLTVKDFRPIACCTTFYKVVSKILGNRLKQVLESIIGPEQAAFVANRDIFYNTMLAHELVSKYGHAYLTPRCLLKVDIRKAFDSVNWGFLKDSMLHLNFPSKFVDWIMACITSPYYLLLINGEVQVFTRGDLPSIQAVAHCLDQFSKLSGLHANPAKTGLYMGGVADDVRKVILDATGFTMGAFSFRYLGLPLFNTRITQDMYQPLLDKIKSRIMHWANHSLSYAGKALLVNFVIFGVNNFWGESVLLPKGIAKRITKLCKNFLWGIADGSRRHVFLK
ncbi:uncharacterized protein LOC141630419 [Silene latifolia]|uniref:uncharacterized protein LOC141630419 n=1 Tax=Silene latifolia TaxID=37657 RepID=UPI003D76B03D